MARSAYRIHFASHLSESVRRDACGRARLVRGRYGAHGRTTAPFTTAPARPTPPAPTASLLCSRRYSRSDIHTRAATAGRSRGRSSDINLTRTREERDERRGARGEERGGARACHRLQYTVSVTHARPRQTLDTGAVTAAGQAEVEVTAESRQWAVLSQESLYGTTIDTPTSRFFKYTWP